MHSGGEPATARCPSPSDLQERQLDLAGLHSSLLAASCLLKYPAVAGGLPATAQHSCQRAQLQSVPAVAQTTSRGVIKPLYANVLRRLSHLL
jgi:hypothetical protein